MKNIPIYDLSFGKQRVLPPGPGRVHFPRSSLSTHRILFSPLFSNKLMYHCCCCLISAVQERLCNIPRLFVLIWTLPALSLLIWILLISIFLRSFPVGIIILWVLKYMEWISSTDQSSISNVGINIDTENTMWDIFLQEQYFSGSLHCYSQ